ncbi:hypothetical protein B5M09_013627 [Aphanomyces astaci]|uniref:DDE-1 domain-containing protein n=1 Tax=Aphanomyces astaci TaxID=112090 RepID=A0A3R8DPX5_APHAT|nr:hypothetical protein B5M09_013627 [Aphanomyces astaci]
MTGYSESSVPEWIRDKPSLLGFQGSKTRKKNARPNGAKPIIPDSADLVTYLKDLRRDEKAVTSSQTMQFLRAGHMAWIQDYMATRASGYNSLLRLLQKFADRHGFPSNEYIALDCLYNADETGVQYDMCPSKMWATRGGGSYVANSETHSYRMTTLLTVRADGAKLPILFVIRGVTADYPEGRFYAMQEKRG